MIAKEKNPGLGTFNNPKPRAALPGYFGIRSESDSTFKNFLNWWAEWNNLLGHNEKRMKEAMLEYSGVTEIPDTVCLLAVARIRPGAASRTASWPSARPVGSLDSAGPRRGRPRELAIGRRRGRSPPFAPAHHAPVRRTAHLPGG